MPATRSFRTASLTRSAACAGKLFTKSRSFLGSPSRRGARLAKRITSAFASVLWEQRADGTSPASHQNHATLVIHDNGVKTLVVGSIDNVLLGVSRATWEGSMP